MIRFKNLEKNFYNSSSNVYFFIQVSFVSITSVFFSFVTNLIFNIYIFDNFAEFYFISSTKVAKSELDEPLQLFRADITRHAAFFSTRVTAVRVNGVGLCLGLLVMEEVNTVARGRGGR